MQVPSTTVHQRIQRQARDLLAGAQAWLRASWPEALLYAAILLGTLARMQAALQYPPSDALWSDPGRHWLYGQNPLAESPMAAIDPIGFQVWLAAVVRIVLRDPLANGAYAGLLSAVTPWLWYRFLWEALPERRLALAGWAALTVLPSWVGIFSYFMTETLFLPALGLALWLTWIARRERSTAALVRATLAWLAASLTRAVAVPMALIALAALLHGTKHALRNTLLVAGIAIACLLPPAYRSYRSIGVWAPFGYPVLNQIYMASGRHTIEVDLYKKNGAFHYIYGFACPSMGEAPLAPLSQWKTSRTGTLRFPVDMDYGARDWKRALREHRAPLRVRMRMTVENWVHLLFGRSWPDCNPARPWDRFAIHSRWLWAPLALLVFMADLCVLARRRTLPLLPVLTLSAWLLVALLPAVPMEGRYRKPLEGLLIANALWAAGQVRRRDPPEAEEAPAVAGLYGGDASAPLVGTIPPRAES